MIQSIKAIGTWGLITGAASGAAYLGARVVHPILFGASINPVAAATLVGVNVAGQRLGSMVPRVIGIPVRIFAFGVAVHAAQVASGTAITSLTQVVAMHVSVISGAVYAVHYSANYAASYAAANFCTVAAVVYEIAIPVVLAAAVLTAVVGLGYCVFRFCILPRMIRKDDGTDGSGDAGSVRAKIRASRRTRALVSGRATGNSGVDGNDGSSGDGVGGAARYSRRPRPCESDNSPLGSSDAGGSIALRRLRTGAHHATGSDSDDDCDVSHHHAHGRPFLLSSSSSSASASRRKRNHATNRGCMPSICSAIWNRIVGARAAARPKHDHDCERYRDVRTPPPLSSSSSSASTADSTGASTATTTTTSTPPFIADSRFHTVQLSSGPESQTPTVRTAAQAGSTASSSAVITAAGDPPTAPMYANLFPVAGDDAATSASVVTDVTIAPHSYTSSLNSSQTLPPIDNT